MSWGENRSGPVWSEEFERQRQQARAREDEIHSSRRATEVPTPSRLAQEQWERAREAAEYGRRVNDSNVMVVTGPFESALVDHERILDEVKGEFITLRGILQPLMAPYEVNAPPHESVRDEVPISEMTKSVYSMTDRLKELLSDIRTTRELLDLS